MHLSLGSKLRACRAILGQTLQDVSNACGIPVASLRAIEIDLTTTRADQVASYYCKRGLFVIETGITTIRPAVEDNIAPEHSDLLPHFMFNEDFAAAYNAWDDYRQSLFRKIILVFVEAGLDIWFVDMNGEIRIGAKPVGAQRGRPVAFLRSTKEGLTLSWNTGVEGALLVFGGELTEAKVSRIQSTLSGVQPQRLKLVEGASGNMPDAYLDTEPAV